MARVAHTVQYMRKGLDTIPISQDYPSKEEAETEFDRLKEAYGEELTLLRIIEGGANVLVTDDYNV